MQLCVGNRCLIVQLFYIDAIPSSLKDFFRAPNVTFVGVGVGNDVQKLRTEYDLSCLHWEDIEPLAMRYRNWSFLGLARPGLKVFAREIVGLRMEKPKHVTQSDWQARELSEAQIQYACIDAYASYKLGVKLLG
ncbi:hypothetical protein QJS10_CPB17g01001 [Acorus calamus]|uniref:3'-5' exonuclease domain-containing protein n=1 Tax=Acorus calamus TaxID=4465 RepID=A0AAV9CT40_ACOCL|nr:hypothetical protein QJS10_CPB17g01001 [Acorus calamus]